MIEELNRRFDVSASPGRLAPESLPLYVLGPDRCMAKLPNHLAAIIPDNKIRGYLLSPTHPEGAPKTKFFESFGFSRATPNILTQALLAHAAAGIVVDMKATPYGTIYEVNGRIGSPGGANPWLLVVWMIDEGTDRPRLITAVPSEDRA